MVIDHLGFFFFPKILFLRIIGRLSFPLFAWCISNGAYHTRNIRNYLIRIFLLAVISQAPFTMAHQLIDSAFWKLNVVFTLFLGLVAIELIKITKKKFFWIIITLFLAIISQLFRTDYGAFGVILIIIFYIFYKDFKKMMLWQTFNFSFFYLIPIIINFQNLFNILQMFGLVSLFFIRLYNQKEGLKAKYLFYTFFPLQYVVIYLLKKYII